MKMFGLETKMQMLVATALRPVVGAQSSQLEQVQKHEQMVQRHDEELRRLKEAILRSARSTAGEEEVTEADVYTPVAAREAADYARLEKSIAALAEAQRLDRRRNDKMAEDLRATAAEQAKALKWTGSTVEAMEADIKKATLGGASVYQIQDMLDSYKTGIAASIRDLTAHVEE